jgi:predicted transcriptional regulator
LASDDTEALRAFLRENVSTFEELETLLFFVRAAPGPRTVSEVAAALHMSEEMAQTALDGLLVASSVLERTAIAGQKPGYRYAPAAELQEVLSKLERAYDEHRLTIVQIMSSNALERVRSSAARRLADAFRLERRKK